MSVLVSDIYGYNHPNTWFDLARYQAFGQSERVHVDLQIDELWTIDSRDLFLNYSYAPKLAFINEGATYRSRLGLNVSGTTTGQATVFEEVSGSDSIIPSKNAPLKIGDWVQISEIKANSQLDFSLFVNSVVNPKPLVLSTDPSLNPNWGNAFGSQFWVAYADPSATRPVIILGYEDVVGGHSDNDYNDGIFVLDVGTENFQSIFETAKLAKIDENSTIAAAQVDLTKPKETSQNLITTQPSAPVVEDATPQDPTAVPEANAGIVYLAMGIALLLGQFSQHRKSNNKSNNKSNRKSNIKSDIPQQS
jgi:hypothetical protein